jgi:hypothetical protein
VLPQPSEHHQIDGAGGKEEQEDDVPQIHRSPLNLSFFGQS